MKIFNLNDSIGGWFVGGFEKAAYYTKDFEVSYKIHKKDEQWPVHYHTTVTEINLLVRGSMTIQNKLLKPNDIFILEPYEIADPTFHEDCEVVCIKTPSCNDKVIVNK